VSCSPECAAADGERYWLEVMTKRMQESQLAALIITILLLVSCSTGPGTAAPAMSNQAHSATYLVGRWRQVSPADEEVTMAFTSDGKLVYSIHAGDKIQIINMVYEVSGNQIITDQPSKPHREISSFSFEPSGILVVDYNGERARFTRE
jgi:uncharacterized protein (TIGR03066 family)